MIMWIAVSQINIQTLYMYSYFSRSLLVFFYDLYTHDPIKHTFTEKKKDFVYFQILYINIYISVEFYFVGFLSKDVSVTFFSYLNYPKTSNWKKFYFSLAD